VIVTLYKGLGGKYRWLPRKTDRLSLALAIFIFMSLAVHSQVHGTASVTPSPSKAESATPIDPLGRETPRSAIIGLLKCAERDDYENAARYLQPTLSLNENLIQRAKEFHALQQRFKSSIALLSDDPNGTIEPGLPPGQVRAGVLVVGSTTVDVILVRVDDPDSGKIWLISKETVASIPGLYAQLKNETPTVMERVIPAGERLVPATLKRQGLLRMSLTQWLGWLLSIPSSWLLAWLIVLLLSVPARIRSKLQNVPFSPIWKGRLVLPIKSINALLIHTLFVYLLQPPLLYRVYYFRLIGVFLVGCFLWLLGTITNRGFELAVDRTRSQNKGGESILVMLQRLTHIMLGIIGLIIALALFGFNVTTTLAGLGIGGLAIALGAQKSLENLIGGISLLMDQAVHVGDVCQIGDRVGMVEDIGLRSLKLRLIDQGLLIIPNGSLAQMEFQNLRARRKLLINQTFALRIETEVEQLRFVLDRVQSMMDQHPAIESGTSRIRVAAFAGAAFALELFAYGKSGDWAHFTAIRQDVILKIAEIVEASGTRLAAPTQLTYLSRDTGVDEEKTNNAVRRVTELRATHSFQFPGESRTGTH